MADEPRRRGPGRPKGTPASKAQREAAAKNQKRASKVLKQRGAERRALEEKPRWQKLEDGDITIKDLELEELIRGYCMNNDGTWEGKRHQLSPSMQQKMRTEFHRRFRQKFDELAPLALQAFEEIIQDDDARAQQWAAAKTMLEYQMGKVPDVVHVGAETEFDRLQQTAFRIVRGEEAVTVNQLPPGSGDGDDDE